MPVTQSFTQAITFAAGHQLAHHATCDKVHGHSYAVSITWNGLPNKDNFGLPMAADKHETAVAVIRELADRYLNDMIPAGYPSVSGVASYLLERLRILGVTKVEVHESDTNATGTSEFIDR